MTERNRGTGDTTATVCDLLLDAAARNPGGPAVIQDGRKVDWIELAGRAGEAARLIRPAARAGGRNDRRGHEAGDSPRVALLADNGIDMVVLYWATLLAGCVSVELNPNLAVAELRVQLGTADPSLVVAEGSLAGRLAGLGLAVTGPGGAGPAVVRPGDAEPGDAALAAALGDAIRGEGERSAAAGPAGELPPVDPGSLASIVFTSGTTGRIKGACLTHSNLAFVTDAIARSFDLERKDPGAGGERFAGNLPLYLTYGKSVLLLAAYLAEPIVFTTRVPSARNLLQMTLEHEVTHLSLVPYFGNLLMELPEFTAASLPRLRRITVAGGAFHPAALDEILRRFPGRLVPMYGLTEASTRATCMPASLTESKRGSCGRAIPGVEVAVMGDEGRILGPGEPGEVVVRGPNVMREYFNDPGATAEVFRDGWLRSGDLGTLDSEGFLTISGRLKDVIKVMGESVSAFSVESAIATFPGVAEVAVRGRPDPRSGEAICAFVVPREGAERDAEAIRRHCADTLGRSRVPALVRFVEALPKTASGKVRKHLLPVEGA